MDDSWTNRRLGAHRSDAVLRMPEGDSLHRAAARLRPLVGLRVDGHLAASARARHRRRRGGRRAPARRRRGGREASPAPLRGRRHGAQPSAHERALARRAGRLDAAPVGRGSSCAARRIEATQWNGPVLTLDQRPGAPARPGPARRGDRAGGARRAAPPRRRGRGRSARCSRISGSSPGSGTCGCRRRSGRSALSPWLPLGGGERRRAARGARVGARRRCAPSVAGAAAAALRLPPRRPAVPALRDADRVPRPGRRQPHRLLVPALPAAR